MKQNHLVTAALLSVLLVGACAGESALPHSTETEAPAPHRSAYAGQEQRAIKSLSADDVEALRTGQGWGLARAAELNGLPGPLHVLEMSEALGLTADQQAQIQQAYDAMKAAAIPLGLALIEHERALDDAFAGGTIDAPTLEHLLGQIADAYQALRYVHLAAHLKTPAILTPEQVEAYNTLRGYATDDPCANVPAGHDPAMWKQHNNCS